jgi:hypothetical protein
VLYKVLCFAIDEERYGFGELEMRAAVERKKLLALELEACQHDPACTVSANAHDLRILENGGIEIYRLFGLIVEPQVRRNFSNVSPPELCDCFQLFA